MKGNDDYKRERRISATLMRKYNLIDYLKLLIDFNSKTDDFKLKPNEFVRIVAIKTREGKDSIVKTFYITSIVELNEIIKKYKYTFNLYIGSSTSKGKMDKTEDMYERKVIFLDFDKKDYPQFDDVRDFTQHIKRKIPCLFNHCLVDSGNGYHIYFAIQKTLDTKRVTRINRNLGKILGADIKATLSTQLMRLPTSLNLKHEAKSVNIISNNYGNPKFKPYSLNKLEKIISFTKQIDEIKQIQQEPPQEYNKESSYYCVEKMIASGGCKGERNFCLGRITKYLQTIKGYNYNNALKIIMDWNKRCSPPKNINEVTADFKRYWESDYKLLGCKLDNQKDQSILNQYCNKFLCKTVYKNDTTQIKCKEINMDNHLLKNCVLKKLKGNHYLILSVLHLHDEGLTLKGIKEAITNSNTNKCCLSRNTLKVVLAELLKQKYIELDKYGTYRLVEIPNFNVGYTRYYYSATILLINGIIKQQDYLVYLCLVRNLQQSKSVSYDALSEDTNIDKSNIGKYIKNLFKAKILCVEKGYTDKGCMCNIYTLVA